MKRLISQHLHLNSTRRIHWAALLLSTLLVAIGAAHFVSARAENWSEPGFPERRRNDEASPRRELQDRRGYYSIRGFTPQPLSPFKQTSHSSGIQEKAKREKDQNNWPQPMELVQYGSSANSSGSTSSSTEPASEPPASSAPVESGAGDLSSHAGSDPVAAGRVRQPQCNPFLPGGARGGVVYSVHDDGQRIQRSGGPLHSESGSTAKIAAGSSSRSAEGKSHVEFQVRHADVPAGEADTLNISCNWEPTVRNVVEARRPQYNPHLLNGLSGDDRKPKADRSGVVEGSASAGPTALGNVLRSPTKATQQDAAKRSVSLKQLASNKSQSLVEKREPTTRHESLSEDVQFLLAPATQKKDSTKESGLRGRTEIAGIARRGRTAGSQQEQPTRTWKQPRVNHVSGDRRARISGQHTNQPRRNPVVKSVTRRSEASSKQTQPPTLAAGTLSAGHQKEKASSPDTRLTLAKRMENKLSLRRDAVKKKHPADKTIAEGATGEFGSNVLSRRQSDVSKKGLHEAVTVEKRKATPMTRLPEVLPAASFESEDRASSRRTHTQQTWSTRNRRAVGTRSRRTEAVRAVPEPVCLSCNQHLPRRNLSSAQARSQDRAEVPQISRQPVERRTPVAHLVHHQPETAASPSDVPAESNGGPSNVAPLQDTNPGPESGVPEPDVVGESSVLHSTETTVDTTYIQPSVEEFYDSGIYPADCGFGCPPGWYATGEALFATRDNEQPASLSTGIQAESFGYDLGGRLTVGRKYDCLDGWEISVMGIELEEEAVATGGPLAARFTSVGGVNISAFNNAVRHEEVYQSNFYNVELNRKWWGWNVFSSTVGLRYMRLEEELGLRSVAANGDIGLFNFQTSNDMWGAHCGIDMIYPIGRLSLEGKGRLGLFGSLADSNLQVSNAGVPQVSGGEDTTEYGALIELGYYATYQLLPRVRLRAGYEFWYIYGVAIVSEQVIAPLAPNSGSGFLRSSGDVFYHGGSAGVEIIW